MDAYGHDGFPDGKPRPVIGRQYSTETHQQLTPKGISIPGRESRQYVPPPLPPPPFVDLDMDTAPNNHGPRSQWESEELERFPTSWNRSREDDSAHAYPDHRRRQSGDDAIRSPKDLRYNLDEGYHSMSVGQPLIGSQLHGERQLHHRGQEKSSQAYDNKLLSKIGKPKTPPSRGSFASAETSPTSSLTFARQPFPQSRSLSFPNSMTSAYSDSPIKTEPGFRFGDSPRSRPSSPGTYSSVAGGRSFTEYRSPTLDTSTRSSTVDSDSYSYHQRFPAPANEHPRAQQKGRRSIGQSSLSNVDESAPLGFGKNTTSLHTSLPTRPVKQENYDQSIFSEPEFRMEESVDQLHLDDRALPPIHRDSVPRHSAHLSHHLKSQRSMVGTKRKTPPIASEASHDGSQPSLQQMASTASHFAQNAPAHLSPGFAQHHGSVSSQSSAGFRNGSYTSSGGPSVGGSSYTSLDQTSPGAISPSDPQHPYQQNITQDAQYNQALSMDPSSRTGPYPDPQQQLHDTAFTDTKPTPPRKEARKNNAPPTLSTSSFICECCPKRPRKFDTVEEKIQHEEEKQYRCLYCRNRFKNKNEAERHQNSLHLRRHSWSCAILANNYMSAFFPSSDLPNMNINPGQSESLPAASDTCGYCGTEFTNEPLDWDERTRHLDMVHKFRECNQSKKFFRADHFRQHLKHSHAGASGKWTNRLEQACIKEEPPATPLDQQNPNGDSTPSQSAPVANMGSINQQNLSQQSPTQINQTPASHPNYSPHPSMIGQQSMVQMDMTNIDPNIGIQQLTNLAPVSNMGSVAPPPQQQQQRQQQQLSTGAGGGYEDLKNDPL